MDKYIMHWKVAKIFLLHFLHGQTSWGHIECNLLYLGILIIKRAQISDTINVDDILSQICHIFIAFFFAWSDYLRSDWMQLRWLGQQN